jgi:hypothetical protein
MSTRIIDPNNINRKKSTDETAPASQPLSTTQGGAGGGTATPTTGQPQQAPQQQQAPSSGSFTDLGKYKQAAQNAGNRIAEGVQSKFATKTRQADIGLKNTSEEFKSSMDRNSGYAATAEGRAGAISNVGSYTAGQAGYQQPPTSPVNNANPNMPQRGVAPSQRVQPTAPPEFTEKDFADVVNREYTGIRRADQTAAYENTLNRAKAIKDYAKLLNDPNSTSKFMKETFGQDQSYNQGMNALDAYLYTKAGAANQLKNNEKVQYAQDFNKRLDQTKADLSASSIERANQIAEMREAARKEFSGVATGRTQQVEDRLDNARKDWNKLTNMVRDSFYTVDPKTGQRVIKSGQVGIDPVTQILTGMGPGSQLFNQIKDEESLNKFIKTREFERDRLISNKEQQNLARLEALSRLAKTPGMEYNNKYYDASRAGTLSARDSIDRENVRNLLGQSMQGFEDLAKTAQTASGYGEGEYKRWGKTKTVGRSSTATGNLDQYLSEKGYEYDQPEYNLYNPLEVQNAIDNIKDVKSAENNVLNQGFYDAIKNAFNFQEQFDEVGQKFYDWANHLSFGLVDNKGNAEEIAQKRADKNAQENLLNQLNKSITESGFSNIATGADMTKEENKQKMQALIDLYNSLDSTNIGNY